MTTPTTEVYDALQYAFHFLNNRFFEAKLPPVLITLQQDRDTTSYFNPQRFGNTAGRQVDQIALNPRYFAVLPVEDVLAALTHNMCHEWQEHFGHAGRRSYHNREFAALMERIGLMTSSTGLPGGKRTGELISQYIIPQSPFVYACQELLTTQFAIAWFDRYPVGNVRRATPAEDLASGVAMLPVQTSEPPAATPAVETMLVKPSTPSGTASSTKHRYSCPVCPKTNAWGKPGLKLICGECNASFTDTTELEAVVG
ncbi:SprT-like domain-containing protein (plasmid) [Burkholderia thailandensis]|uniref:SprT-like domain-containing protein n=1 Tax=Burkholderia thailandensis TaxID=57975 RepID=UPI00192DDB50|nr:SprT-like domain-containing protein [Burkholderia thailandensis]MBS2132079.1 SprT-like domain-containing protein [Burkholderia thailandensis]QRA15192.1 SprT-like domain-containing protein [Burkholderia thailandensis]